jgi:hypothetical protein
MKRFVVRLIGLWLMLAGGLFAVIVVGRVAPLPASIQAIGFDRCGEAPCFMHILPGYTPWRDTHMAMAKRPDSNVWDKRIIVKSTVGSEAALYPSFSGETIGRVYITPSRYTPLSVGWIVQRYGPPCGVSVYYETGIMTLRYPFLLANIRLVDNYLDLNAPVAQLQLTDPVFFSKLRPNPCVENVTGWKMEIRTWQGFASVRHYLTHTP